LSKTFVIVYNPSQLLSSWLSGGGNGVGPWSSFIFSRAQTNSCCASLENKKRLIIIIGLSFSIVFYFFFVSPTHRKISSRLGPASGTRKLIKNKYCRVVVHTVHSSLLLLLLLL
jgi:hypothetical protein